MMATQSERLDKLELHILDIKGQTSNIESTNSDIEKSMTFMSEQIASIESQITKLERDRNTMATELSAIQGKIDSFDRYIAKTSIEIRNIPKKTRETKDMLYNTVEQLAKFLNLDLVPSDVRDVTRMPSKKDQKTATILVEFSNTLIKSRYLASAKDFNKKNSDNKLNNTHLGFAEPKAPIFIDELLTPAAKKLFYLTRTFIKQSNRYNFCWTSDGKIFVKENKDTPYFQIKNEDQLIALQSPE